MRPKYETQKDLDNEKDIAGFLEKQWDCELLNWIPLNGKLTI